ncbi:hypothetical protein D3C80_1896960 [compost metagenome]
MLLNVADRLIHDICRFSLRRHFVQLAHHLVHEQVKDGFGFKPGQLSSAKPGVVNITGMLVKQRRELWNETERLCRKSRRVNECVLCSGLAFI